MRPSKFLSASGLSPRGGGSGTPHPPPPGPARRAPTPRRASPAHTRVTCHGTEKTRLSARSMAAPDPKRVKLDLERAWAAACLAKATEGARNDVRATVQHWAWPPPDTCFENNVTTKMT